MAVPLYDYVLKIDPDRKQGLSIITGDSSILFFWRGCCESAGQTIICCEVFTLVSPAKVIWETIDLWFLLKAVMVRGVERDGWEACLRTFRKDPKRCQHE